MALALGQADDGTGEIADGYVVYAAVGKGPKVKWNLRGKSIDAKNGFRCRKPTRQRCLLRVDSVPSKSRYLGPWALGLGPWDPWIKGP